MYYEKSEGNDRKSAIRRRRELVMRDEEEFASAHDAIQPKLEISQPEDAQEKEADLVARKVVEGGDAQIANPVSASSSVNTKSEGDSTLYADDKLQRSLDSSKGSGQSMDDATKSEMETKMGADFSGVKIHTDSAAHEMSEDINAKAFTHGQDVYFKNGNYDPGSGAGKELLAHELHHTRQNGGGVNRKVWRAVEDIGTINKQVQEMNLDDFSGLKIQVMGGYIPIFDSLKATENSSKADTGYVVKVGKKVENRYEILELISPKGTKQENKSETNSTSPVKDSQKQYAEIGGEEWADMIILELLPERLLYRALANPGDDLSFYKIKVKWNLLNLYEDVATTRFSKENASKNQELQLLGKTTNGSYPVDITDKSGTVVRKYVDGRVSKKSFEIISVSKDRYAYDINQSRGEITDLTGYKIRVLKTDEYFRAYPSEDVEYGSVPIEGGTEINILAKYEFTPGQVYYKAEANKVNGYIPGGIAVSDHEIVSAPTSLGKVKDQVTLSNEADVQAERNLKVATVDFKKIQTILKLAADNIGKENKDFNTSFDKLTAAEISVFRGEHRMMLLKALITNKGQSERVIRLLENTGMEVSGEMHDFLMADQKTYDTLMSDMVSSDEDKKKMAAAIGAAAGKNDFQLAKLKELLANSEDYSGIDEFAYTLSDQDMTSLDAKTRGDLINAMLIEADYYWSISSDEDDETMVRLVRTARRDDPEDPDLLAFRERIHPNVKGTDGKPPADNLYTRLVETMATDYVRDFQKALSEIYPNEVNEVLLHQLQEWLKLPENLDYYSDEILEATYTLSPAAIRMLSVKEKVAILDSAFTEFEVGGEEETALVNLMSNVVSEEYAEMREALEADGYTGSFHRLYQLVSRIDEEGNSDLRNALNPIMEPGIDDAGAPIQSNLVKKIKELLSNKDSYAEHFMFLLTDGLIEGLSFEERRDMIIESADYWADGTDETVIIRLINKIPDDPKQKKDLYDWFQIVDGGETNLTWVQSAVDGSNTDLFLQAVGALKDNQQALTDAKSGYGYGAASDDVVLQSIGLLTNDQMAMLDLDTRIDYIRHICNYTGIVWTHGENIVTRLISTTPPSPDKSGDQRSQITRLFEKFSENGGELYTQVHEALDDETFNAMQQALQALVTTQRYADAEANPALAFERKKEEELMRQEGFMHEKAILWQAMSQDATVVKFVKGEEGHKMMGPDDKEKKTDTRNMIQVDFSLTGSKKQALDFWANHRNYEMHEVQRETPGDGKTESSKRKYTAYVFTAYFKPDDLISVITVSGYSSADVFNSAAQVNTRVNVMPAIGLFEMQVEVEREVREAMLLMLDIILLAVGIGELTMALRGIRLAFAIADVVIGALALGVKAFRKQLMESEEGRVFLGIVDGISMAYGVVGIGRLAAGLYSMGKVMRLRSQLSVLKGVVKDGELLRSLETLVSKIEQPGPLYKTLFKISNEGEYTAAMTMIDSFPGLMKAEREGLRSLAKLKLAHPQMGPKAFLNFLSEAQSEEILRAKNILNKDDLFKYRQELDELERTGKITKGQRELADMEATSNVKRQDAARIAAGKSKAVEESLSEIEKRILDAEGNIDPVKLQKHIDDLKAKGVEVMTGDEAKVLLNKRQANALYVPGEGGKPGMLVFSESAPKNRIIEELMHLEQHKLEGFRKLLPEEIIEMEIDAHNQLLKYARKNKWEQKYIDELEQNRASWLKDKSKYEKDMNFRKKFDEEHGGEFRSRKGPAPRKIPTDENILDLKNTQVEVNQMLSQSVDEINDIYPNSIVGYRGSLATGFKYETGDPFTSKLFDVDGFIVNNHLAEDLGKYETWRNAYNLDEFKDIIDDIHHQLMKKFPGYKLKGDKFTFRVWTTDEYRRIVIPEGAKTIK